MSAAERAASTYGRAYAIRLGMSPPRAEAVTRCLVELARLEAGDQLAALAAIVRTWLERDRGVRAAVWAAACRAAGKPG